MPKGGKRPGAGAPPGNSNALKNGKYTLAERTLRMDHRSKRAFLAVLKEAESLGMAKETSDRLRSLVTRKPPTGRRDKSQIQNVQ